MSLIHVGRRYIVQYIASISDTLHLNNRNVNNKVISVSQLKVRVTLSQISIMNPQNGITMRDGRICTFNSVRGMGEASIKRLNYYYN